MSKPLTKAMLRELRSIEHDGNPSDPVDWQHAPDSLWFHVRDKVLTALITRGLIASSIGGYDITDAGKAALQATPLTSRSPCRIR